MTAPPSNGINGSTEALTRATLHHKPSRGDIEFIDAPSGNFRPVGARPAGPDAVVCFNDTRQHLMAELECLDLYIQAQVARARARHQADEQFQGLYISEQEIDELLARPAGLPRWAMPRRGPRACFHSSRMQ